MGRSGGGSAADSGMPVPSVNMQEYRAQRNILANLVRERKLTRFDMRNQLRELRGLSPLERPSRRSVANSKLSAQRQNSVITPKPQPETQPITNMSTTAQSEIVDNNPTLPSPAEIQMPTLSTITQAISDFSQSLFSVSLPSEDASNAEWTAWIDSVLPTDSIIPADIREALVENSFDINDSDIPELTSTNIEKIPEGIKEVVSDIVLHGTKTAAPFEATRTEQITENATSTAKRKLYERIANALGINTWSLTENENNNELAVRTQQVIDELTSLKQQQIESFVEYEKEWARYAELIQLKKLMKDTTSKYRKMDVEARMRLLDIADVADSYAAVIEKKLKKMEEQMKERWRKQEALSLTNPRTSPELTQFFDENLGIAVNSQMQQNAGSFVWGSALITDIVSPKTQSEVSRALTEAGEFFDKYVDARLHPRRPVVEFSKTTMLHGQKMTSSYFDPSTGKVHIVGDEQMGSTVVLLHELMHHMEFEDRKLQQHVEGFFLSRMQKDNTMNVWEQGGEQASWAPDDFPDWYCGMIQPWYDGSLKPVEILSMGVTLLFHNPVQFAKEQPEYFRFVTSTLSGEWLDVPTSVSNPKAAAWENYS